MSMITSKKKPNPRLKANYDKSQYTANFYDSTGKRFRRHKKED